MNNKVKINGVVFFGNGKFCVTYLVPAKSGTSKKTGDYEGYGYTVPYQGLFGNTTPELKEKLVAAVKSGTPVQLYYDCRGSIADVG